MKKKNNKKTKPIEKQNQLPKILKEIMVDTSRLKEKKSSTKILNELRYCNK